MIVAGKTGILTVANLTSTRDCESRIGATTSTYNYKSRVGFKFIPTHDWQLWVGIVTHSFVNNFQK